jgi:hypothetical protein
MRLALASDRRPGPLRPRNGNRICLVTCIVTVSVAVFVVLKVTGSSCPADPRAAGGAAVAGATSPDSSAASRTDAGGTAAGGTGASALAASPALARSVMQGQAVFYDPGQAAGSCGLGPFPARGRYASLPPRGYASGRACGSYLDVSGPRGTVRAEVVDVCTDCAAGRPGGRWQQLTPSADGYWIGPLRPGRPRAGVHPAGRQVPASGSGSPMRPAIRWCSPGFRAGAPSSTPPRGCTGAGDWRAPRPPRRRPRPRGRAATPGRPGHCSAADWVRDQRRARRA